MSKHYGDSAKFVGTQRTTQGYYRSMLHGNIVSEIDILDTIKKVVMNYLAAN